MEKAIEHTAAIFWPNGMGETPCSEAYAKAKDERDAIYEAGNDDGTTMDDLTPEEYQRWNELDHELGNMQINGHLGASIRY